MHLIQHPRSSLRRAVSVSLKSQLAIALAATVFSAVGFAPEAFAAPPAKSPAKPAPKASASGNRVLWDRWYTMTVQPNVRYGYYSERAEIRDGKFFLEQKTWKNEEGFINREQLGLVLKTDAELTPVLYTYLRTYRSGESSLDGTISEDRNLSVKIREGAEAKPKTVQKSLPKGVTFSGAFPLWLSQHLKEFRPEGSHSYLAFLEDRPDDNFKIESGMVRPKAQDALAKKTSTALVGVRFADVDSNWYVRPDGSAHRIEIDRGRIIIQEVAKDQALKFLSGGP